MIRGRLPLGGDGGSVLLLGIGAVALVLSLLLVCVDVAALALRRREALLAADTGARAAAQALDLAAYYTGGTGPRGRLPLDAAGARARARSAVGPSWQVRSVEVAMGEVTVTVQGRVEFLIGSSMGLPGADVSGTSSAVLRRS